MNDKIAKTPKSSLGVKASYCPPHSPAIRFPIKLVKNQHPIVRERNFLGASFETKDKPIGDRQSSAIVIIKYPRTNQSGETREFIDKCPA